MTSQAGPVILTIVNFHGSTILTTVGTRVRTLRREKGLSVEELCVSAKVSSSTLNRLERVGAVPKLTLLERIAGALDTSASELLDGASLLSGERT